MKRISIFASGRGSNLEAVLKKVKKGEIRAKVPFCFSDKPGASAMKKAARLGFNTIEFSPKLFTTKDNYEQEIIKLLKKHKVDYIILAGYMRILGDGFVRKFKNRILNIHPAILPSFKGDQAIKDAYDYGVKITGVTVHFVTEDVDGGPVILQEAVMVRKTDTLASLETKIHRIEHKLYPQAINLVLKNRVRIKGRKVIIK